MAYEKQGFVANETIVTAAALNHMEDGIAQAAATADVAARPGVYALDGADLSAVFDDAAAFRAAVAAGDFSRVRVGDYWPVTLNGSFRDYGAYTVPAGTAYYTDAALTAPGGTTSGALEGQYESATAVKCTISGATAYCAVGDCLPYFERTLNNAVVNLEVAGINTYWRYGDAGTLIGNNAPHVVFVSRDCLPFTMRMRKASAVWENAEDANPWHGSALYRTLNDPDHGVVALLAATDLGAHVYAGPNGNGMRAMLEVKAGDAPNATSWAWTDRGRLFLPLEHEVWGHVIWGGNSGYAFGLNVQLPIFSGTLRHICKGLGHNGYRANWWTASTRAGSALAFCYVSNGVVPSGSSPGNAYAVPVCFVLA